MARRSASFQQLFLDTLDGVGQTAMQAGKLVGDSRRADAENTRADTESKARVGLVGEQTRGAKTDADSKALSYDEALRETTMKKALEAAAEARTTAQEGTPTADGRAVDFQEIKKANRGFERADMGLYNFLNPNNPMDAGRLKEKRERDEAGEVVAAEEKEFGLGEKKNKAGRDAAESAAGIAETNARTKLLGFQASGEKDKAARDRFKEITDEKGNVHRWNMDTNEITPVGINKGVSGPKPVDPVDAIADAERGLGVIDQMIGSEDGKTREHPGFRSAVGAKGLSSGFGLREKPVDGTEAADFMSLYDQITGQAFMTAFQSLKGGGTITEQEGQKAQAAITRMKTSTSEGEFIKAANEFRSVIRSGVEKAKRKAEGRGAPAAPAAGAAPAAADEDSQAVEWAKANPNDPRAKQILQLNGAR